MDLNGVRRATSAGYRLPERNNGTRPISSQPPAERTHRAKGDAASAERNPDKSDPVKQDLVWTEVVRTEKRVVGEWEKNWGFLKHYDQMGQLKPEEPLPSYVSLFSDRVPNTTSQMLGSRLTTPLGSELVRLDRLTLWPGSHHRRKQDPEMLPW
ncbi:ciliary microtubule inner protein 5 [Symphorus nematophorus]